MCGCTTAQACHRHQMPKESTTAAMNEQREEPTERMMYQQVRLRAMADAKALIESHPTPTADRIATTITSAVLAEIETWRGADDMSATDNADQWFCDVAQLMDGWHADAAWSEWDERLRQQLVHVRAETSTLRGDNEILSAQVTEAFAQRDDAWRELATLRAQLAEREAEVERLKKGLRILEADRDLAVMAVARADAQLSEVTRELEAERSKR